MRLELTTVGLEIRCADPLRHVCIKVGMMGIEPIFTLLGPTSYKAVALSCSRYIPAPTGGLEPPTFSLCQSCIAWLQNFIEVLILLRRMHPHFVRSNDLLHKSLPETGSWTTIVLHRDIKYRVRVELTESGFADRTAAATYGTYNSRNRNRTYIFWVRVRCDTLHYSAISRS